MTVLLVVGETGECVVLDPVTLAYLRAAIPLAELEARRQHIREGQPPPAPPKALKQAEAIFARRGSVKEHEEALGNPDAPAVHEAAYGQDVMVTTKQAAALGFGHPKTIERWCRDGKIPSIRPGRRYLIRLADLETSTTRA